MENVFVGGGRPELFTSDPAETCCFCPTTDVAISDPIPICGRPVAYLITSAVNHLGAADGDYPTCEYHAAWLRAEAPQSVVRIRSVDEVA